MKWYHWLLVVILMLFVIWIVIYLILLWKEIRSGKELPPKRKGVKKKSLIKRIYWDWVKIMIEDRFNYNQDEFKESGLHLFVGEQGSGKTIGVIHFIQSLKVKYPLSKVRTNMNYMYEDGSITSWRDLVFINNGIYGQIDLIDEIQQWFNSLESKNFPVEMLSEVSQQRKQRKVIVGTSQVWGRVAKPIREQVSFVYKPITIAGNFTIIRKYKPNVTEDGSLEKLKLRSMYFFIHNDKIRNSFDTYKKIETQSLKGFKDTSLHMSTLSQGINQQVGDTATADTIPRFFKRT